MKRILAIILALGAIGQIVAQQVYRTDFSVYDVRENALKKDHSKTERHIRFAPKKLEIVENVEVVGQTINTPTAWSDYNVYLHLENTTKAYDLVVNGTEIGGGSIRIYDRNMQNDMFKALGFSDEEAQEQFGFLLNAFEFGAPPHGGIAFGFDRMCSMFAGVETIRDFIAFPKNNKARDIMIESPSEISPAQLEELNISLIPKQ